MGFEYQDLATSCFQMPDRWRLATIQEVAKVNEKSITKRNSPLRIQYIDIASVKKGRLLNIQELPFEKAPSGARRIVKNKDSLIATVRPNLENFLFVKEPKLNTIVSTGFAVVSAKTADPRFLYYYMTSKPFTAYLTQIAEGHTSVYPAFNPDVIKKAEIILPTDNEQRAIAHILGSLDDKIELNWRMNETLEAMAQALFKGWFIDFDPVIDNALAAGNSIPDELQPRAKLRESLGDARKPLSDEVRDLFPSEFEPTEEMGWIPKGWEIQPLYEIANFINGAAYKDFHFTTAPDALPVLKIAEIKNGISGQTKFTKTELADKYRIDNGDILFSWSGNPDTSIDTFVWSDGPGWLNQHIFRVALLNDCDRNFVYYQLKALRSVFAEIARDKQTTGLGHVTAQDMKRLYVFKCNDLILKAFNNYSDPYFNRWYANLLSVRNHSKLRDTLLPKLLSGEIRIPEAAKLMRISA